MRDGPRLPDWLVKPLSDPRKTSAVRSALHSHRLNTVCDEARCPNRAECFAEGTATFMILGERCTRDCAFCAVEHGRPRPPDADEPRRIVEAARELGLDFVVLTSVTRDDLADGGASHFADTVTALRASIERVTVEVLIPDFAGSRRSLSAVLASEPDVLGHNLETVERLYPDARTGADYGRSLELLERAARSSSEAVVKSAIMLGLGERRREVDRALRDMRGVGVRIVCVGQYLRPTRSHAPVARYVDPGEFEEVRDFALGLGFDYVSAGPFVRSSYRAKEALDAARGAHDEPQATVKE